MQWCHWKRLEVKHGEVGNHECSQSELQFCTTTAIPKDADLWVKAVEGLDEDDNKQGLGSCSILITKPKHKCRLRTYKQTREDVYSNYTIYAVKGFVNHICLSPAFTPHRLSFSPHRYRQIRQPCLKSN
jgi:hypothetical protein